MNSRLFWIFAPPSGVELSHSQTKQKKKSISTAKFPPRPNELAAESALHSNHRSPSVSLDSNLFLPGLEQAYDRRYETISSHSVADI